MNPGTLSSVAYEIWETWLTLNTFRSHTGFGPSPLRMIDIISYLYVSNVPRRYMRSCVRMLAAIEHEYLTYIGKRAEKAKRRT